MTWKAKPHLTTGVAHFGEDDLDYYNTPEYRELLLLNNKLNNDPDFNLQIEVLAGNKDAIRLWELFTKANKNKFDEIPTLQTLQQEIRRLSEQFESRRGSAKPEMPSKPAEGSNVDIWFDWFHLMKEQGFRCSLKEIASETSHNYGYIRQLHTQYANKNGLAKPRKRTNRKSNKN